MTRPLVLFLTVGILWSSASAREKKRPPTEPGSTACRVYFIGLEQDEETVSLRMVGLDNAQADYYKGYGGRYPNICVLNPDSSGKRVAINGLNDSFDDHASSVTAGRPLYLIQWEQHRVVVPDGNGGHYAWSANGALYRWDYEKKDFVAVCPIHNVNRWIFYSAAVSLLEEGLREVAERERLLDLDK